MPRAPNTSPQTLLVLSLLLQSPRAWHYGYGISQQTDLRSGTLYPMLSRLAEQGWLETKWSKPDQSGRPPRHTYRLTPDGVRAARRLLSAAADSGLGIAAALPGGRTR